MSETVVQYEGSLRCTARHAESGVVVTTDAPKDNQGSGESFSPSEYLSVALGSCILSIMGMKASSMGIDMGGATATIVKHMANAPRRIASISAHVHVPAVLSEDQQQKLMTSAHACPVHNVLNVDAPITFTWGSPFNDATAGRA